MRDWNGYDQAVVVLTELSVAYLWGIEIRNVCKFLHAEMEVCSLPMRDWNHYSQEVLAIARLCL